MADSVLVTYGSYTLPQIIGKFNFSINYVNVYFSGNFVVVGDTQAAFVAACEEAERECRKIHQDFSVKFGDTDTFHFKHSDNTGFNSDSILKIVPNIAHTGLSREYNFTVKMGLPADLAGDDYIRNTSIILNEDETKRDNLTVRGVVTAHDAKSATQSYEDNAIPWADSVAQSVFGVSNFERLKARQVWDRENKILNFTLIYHQMLDITVTYNSYSIPNSFSEYDFSESYGEMRFTCKFKISNSSASAAEIALRQPNKDLLVTVGSLSYSYSHGSNTGMLGMPHLEKVSNKTDDKDYTHYRFSITMQLPADEVGKNYLKSGNYSVMWMPNRVRSMEFTGIYTAGGANSSYANAEDYAETWALSIIAALGITNYERLSKNYSTEKESKLTNFKLVYRELASKDTFDEWNDVRIADAQSTYTVDIGQEIGRQQTTGINALPPIRVSYEYTCWISKETVSNDTNLTLVYENVIRPWLIKQIGNVSGIGNYFQGGSSNLIVESETKRISPTEYKVTGNMTTLAPSSADQILLFSEVLMTDDFTGLVDNKIWNGKDYGRSLWFTGAERVVRRVTTITKLGSPQLLPPPITPADRYWCRSRHIVDFEFFRGIGNPVDGVVSSPVYQTAFTEIFVYAIPSTAIQTGSII